MTNLTKTEIKKIVKENNIHFLRLQFTDTFGFLKNVEIPATQIDKALDEGVMFDGSSIDGFARIEESDMHLVPDLSTFAILPWLKEDTGATARFVCDVYTPNGKPFEGDPRYILRKP